MNHRNWILSSAKGSDPFAERFVLLKINSYIKEVFSIILEASFSFKEGNLKISSIIHEKMYWAQVKQNG